MANIDPVLFLQPALSAAIATGAILYWWSKRGFGGVPLLLASGAFFAAIALKYSIQVPTGQLVYVAFGRVSIVTGLYLGLQTVFLEVGLAYLLALYAARRGKFKTQDAVPYGLSLAFWENGVLLGVVSVLNLGVIYLLLGSGSANAEATYSSLLAAQPSLFLPPGALLPSVLLGTLERVSSMLIHVAWGMLCVFAAVSGRKRYLAWALPMGLVDAAVPFAFLNTTLFEAGLFALSLGFVLIAWRAKRTFSGLPASGSQS